MKLAFLGLGRMGAAIAGRLAGAGHDVAVWNRSPGKAEAIAGVTSAATPRAAADGVEVAFTMVADDAALMAVLEGPDGLLAGLGEGAIHVSQSTISVATAERVAALHAERGQRFVSAPVFGRPAAAEAGQLWIAAAGPEAALDELAPLFETIGRQTFRIGEAPASANLVKLAGNFTILASAEVFAEAIAFAERGGVPRARMLELLQGTLFDSVFARIYGPLIAEQRWRPAGFTAPLGLKDMRLAGEAADAVGATLPILAIVRDHLSQAIAREGEDVDVAALAVALS